MTTQQESASTAASAGSSAGSRIPVVVVDDESGIRLTIKVVLQQSKKFRFAAEFDSGDALMRGWSEQLAPIVLMDLKMPGSSAFECIQRLKGRDGAVKVVVLSGYLDSQAMSEACHSGADGFLCKPVEPDKLVKALEFCLHGGIPVDTELRGQMRCLMDDDSSIQPDDPRLDDKHNALMRALAKAASYEKISSDLGMTLPQVRRGLNRVYKFYKVDNRMDAVEMWRRGRKVRR